MKTTARVGLQAPESWKRYYFVFETIDKLATYGNWSKYCKTIERIRLSSGGMLANGIAVIIADVPLFFNRDEVEERFNDNLKRRNWAQERKAVEKVRDYLVSKGIVKRGLLIDNSSHNFGRLIKDYVQEKLENNKRPAEWDNLTQVYRWELPGYLMRKEPDEQS
jgi:hypothetical protein